MEASLLISLLIFLSVLLITYVFIPWAGALWKDIEKERASEDRAALEDMFVFIKEKFLFLLYIIFPVILGLILFFIYKKTPFIIVGVVVGFLLPLLSTKLKDHRRRNKFKHQLIDSLLIMSSCLKGGLSLVQALEVLAEEMPTPMHEEITLLLREHKMGVPIENALERLNKRMYSEELALIVSAILVARETGGDLTKVFSRLIATMRDRFKLVEMIDTLTLQGKLQGFIMVLIPIFFGYFVYKTNPHHFDIMFQTDIGRILLGAVVVAEIIAALLIWKFSIIKV